MQKHAVGVVPARVLTVDRVLDEEACDWQGSVGIDGGRARERVTDRVPHAVMQEQLRQIAKRPYGPARYDARPIVGYEAVAEGGGIGTHG